MKSPDSTAALFGTAGAYDPSIDTRRIQKGLLKRMVTLGCVAMFAFMVAYALVDVRILFWVEFAFLIVSIGLLWWLERPGVNVSTLTFLEALGCFVVVAANTIVLGGLVGSGVFAVWMFPPPVAAALLVDGIRRYVLYGLTVVYLVAFPIIDPYLTLHPIEKIPSHLIPFFIILNVSFAILVVVGSLAYYHDALRAEKLVVAEDQQRYRLTLEQMPLAIALKDSAGQYRFVNQAFAKTFDCSSSAALIDENALLDAADAAHARSIEAAVAADGITRHGEEAVALRGEPRTLRSTRLLLHDRTGEPLLCWVSEDVTEQLRAVRSLQNERYLQALGTLAGGIAHDFNNLLMTILGNLEVLGLEPLESPAQTRLQSARRAAVQGRDLTRQILTFAQGGEPSRKLTSLGGVVEESATFALTGTNARLRLDLAKGLPTVRVDAGQISRVIHNLVLNASQAMPDGGEVVVKAFRTADEPIDGLVAGQRYLRIDVIDVGEGIAAERLQSVFDPFYTTRNRGSGLGLATSQSIVRQHGGVLRLQSRLGAGTCASVYLPVSVEKRARATPTAHASRTTASRRLLVMDDDPAVLSTLCEMLLALGHETTACENGESAFAVYAEAMKRGRPFHGAFLDLTVRGGLGGADLAPRLLALHPDACLVVASGYADQSGREHLQRLGFRGVLAKPFTLAEIRALLEELFGAAKS